MKLGESVRIYDEHDEAIGVIRREEVPELGEMFVPYGLFNDYSKERLTPEDTLVEAQMAIEEWQYS